MDVARIGMHSNRFGALGSLLVCELLFVSLAYRTLSLPCGTNEAGE
jgi:hypothetical protein